LELLTVAELDEDIDRPFLIVLVFIYSDFSSAPNAYDTMCDKEATKVQSERTVECGREFRAYAVDKLLKSRQPVFLQQDGH
jgi:hypothetical protein